MSKAEQHALSLRNVAVQVARTKGRRSAAGVWSYADKRLRIELDTSDPNALTVWKISERESKVLAVIWQEVKADANDDASGDAVVVVHRGGSWEDSLLRVAKGCA
jgi:hypothetical protein